MNHVNAQVNDNGKRIALTPHTLDILEREAKAIKLKGQHFKVNAAKLANAMIEVFCARYLEKEREQIEKLFFDKRTYLKSLIDKSDSEADLSASISEFLQISKKKRKAKSKTE